MRYTILSVLAAAASAVSAYTQPDTTKFPNPSGNPIFTPGLNQIVPAGKPFEVTWNATTPGTVTILLLRGPSNNAVPQYAIVEMIPNSGHYTWTPATNLVADVTRYGLEIVVDATGQYQYSTQFGISNDAVVSSSTTSTSTQISSTVVSPSSYTAPSSSATASSTVSPPVYTTYTSASSSSSSVSTQSSSSTTATSSAPTSYQTTFSYSTITSSKIGSTTSATIPVVSTPATSSKPISTLAAPKPTTSTNTSTVAPPQQTGAASVNGVQTGLSIAIALVGAIVFTF